MGSEITHLTSEAKKEIEQIQAEVRRRSGEKPSQSDVIQGLLEAIDREQAALQAHEIRSRRKKKRGNKSVFDDLFSL